MTRRSCSCAPRGRNSSIRRADWGGGKLNAATLLLQPLDAKASAELIANLLGGAGLAPEASDRLTEAAGGNPLFVEQMLSMMIDDGMLVRQDGAWIPASDLCSVTVPPSVAALLAARLERLTEDERRTIECAAVIGKEFYAGAVRDLLPEPLRDDAPDLIRSLIRKELVRTDRSMVPGEEAFRFRHILIRDAAYQAIPKERRADLHEGFAAWIGRVGGERAEEQDEIVGYHLEQAFRYRQELGPLDDQARRLARQASDRLAAAGSRAHARHDMRAVVNLLGRAEALLDPVRSCSTRAPPGPVGGALGGWTHRRGDRAHVGVPRPGRGPRRPRAHRVRHAFRLVAAGRAGSDRSTSRGPMPKTPSGSSRRRGTSAAWLVRGR